MNEQESNTCAICGGTIPRPAYQWKPLSQLEFPKIETPYLDLLRTAERKKYCPGHPEPAIKHDGRLNEDGSHNVYPNNFGGIAIHGNDGITWMDAKEALSLLAWLLQEKAELQRLAKEQEG